jgi:formiminotetrahydrofolate cyclodeaminase
MTTVLQSTVEDYLSRLGSGSAVPGGGSAAALAAAMGVALLSMVAKISAKKAPTEQGRAQLLGLVPELDALQRRLGELSQEDIDAYRAVIDTRKAGASPADLANAVVRAAEVPLESASLAARALDLFDPLSSHTWAMTQSDLEAGRALLEVGLRVALANVAVNLPDLEPGVRLRIEAASKQLAARRAG